MISFDIFDREKQKNASRKHLVSDKIPATIYGKSLKESLVVFVDRKTFEKKKKEIKSNSLLTLKYNDKEYKALLKDYTFHLKKDILTHLDLQVVQEEEKIKLQVPFKVSGRAKGITKGGTLYTYSDNIKVKCLVKDIPAEIVKDITDLDVGEIVYLNDLKNDSSGKVEYLDALDKALVSVNLSSKETSKANKDKEGKVEESKAEESKEEKK